MAFCWYFETAVWLHKQNSHKTKFLCSIRRFLHKRTPSGVNSKVFATHYEKFWLCALTRAPGLCYHHSLNYYYNLHAIALRIKSGTWSSARGQRQYPITTTRLRNPWTTINFSKGPSMNMARHFGNHPVQNCQPQLATTNLPQKRLLMNRIGLFERLFMVGGCMVMSWWRWRTDYQGKGVGEDPSFHSPTASPSSTAETGSLFLNRGIFVLVEAQSVDSQTKKWSDVEEQNVCHYSLLYFIRCSGWI